MNLSKIKIREIFPGFEGKFIHGEKISCVFSDVKKNPRVDSHKHHHEQIMHVINGKFEFTLGGVKKIYNDGDLVIIPSNIEHSGLALTDCKLMDIFSPVREEYK